MKEAMWKIDETGEYLFSDGVNPNQAILFTPDPGRDLGIKLWERFRGCKVYSDEIIEYTCNDTPYLPKHARAALKLLEEKAGLDGHRIEVSERRRNGKRRKKNTYPPGTYITFID